MPALDFHIRRGRDELSEFTHMLNRVAEPPREALEAGAREFEAVMRESYPTVSLPRPAYPFVSEKQRLYVMAAIRRGEIEMPYQRKFKLANGWDIEAEAPDRWHVRSITPYASYVQGGRQSRYMAGLGWKKIPVVYRANRDRINQAMRKATFRKWAKRAL
jgi:hypothetical protein